MNVERLNELENQVHECRSEIELLRFQKNEQSELIGQQREMIEELRRDRDHFRTVYHSLWEAMRER